jgi:L-amino acid N-acyltransferase YncA
VFNVAGGAPGGGILGFQCLEPHSCIEPAYEHIGDISTFVALEAQRRGVGRTLMRATIGAAARLGFRKVVATIRADNPQAIAFYQSQEFSIVGTARRHARVRGVDLDEVLMERWIG